MANNKGTPRVQYSCSFCGKSQEQVHRLIAGPGGVYICDECIDLCHQIIEEGQASTLPGSENIRSGASATTARRPSRQATPARWEYMDLQVGYPIQDKGGYVKWVNGQEDARFGKNETLVFKALQIMGIEGWELVAVDNPNGQTTNDPHYILKRPISPTSVNWLAQEGALRATPKSQPPARRRWRYPRRRR